MDPNLQKGPFARTAKAASVAILTLTIALSCSDSNEDVMLSGESDSGGSYGNVAHAAPGDQDDPVMPSNPSLVSIRLAKVPKLEVEFLDDEYHHEVIYKADCTILNIYPPQGKKVSLVATAKNGDEVIAQASTTILPVAKMGSIDLDLESTAGDYILSAGAENPLEMGTNQLKGPVKHQTLEGETQRVIYAVRKANGQENFRVTWTGPEKMYFFIDSKPVCQTEDTDVTLEDGQTLGICAVVTSDDAEAEICLEPLDKE